MASPIICPQSMGLFQVSNISPFTLIAQPTSISQENEKLGNTRLKQLETHRAYDPHLRDHNLAGRWVCSLRENSYVICPYSHYADFIFSLVINCQEKRIIDSYFSQRIVSCRYISFKPVEGGWKAADNNPVYPTLKKFCNAYGAWYPEKTPSYYCNLLTFEIANRLPELLKQCLGGYILAHDSQNGSLVFSYKHNQKTAVRNYKLLATEYGYQVTTEQGYLISAQFHKTIFLAVKFVISGKAAKCISNEDSLNRANCPIANQNTDVAAAYSHNQS